MIVLNSTEAVTAFAKGGNVTIGGQLGATAGPIGVGGAISAALTNPSPILLVERSNRGIRD